MREATHTAGPPANASSTNDEVVLLLPAAPEYLRLARMVAAGLASRVGFTYDDIEDLRIAVDELCYVLVGSHGHNGNLALTYRLEPDALTIDGIARLLDDGDSDARLGTEPNDLSEQIVAAVVDEYTLAMHDAAPRFWLRKKATGLR